MTSSHAIRTAVLALAVCASGASTAATITNAELSAVRWTGFDWDSNGSALITGFQPVPGNAFDLELYAWAGVIKNGITYTTALLDQNPDGIPDHAGGYEYTMYAKLRESVIFCVADVCTFTIVGGRYEIWYDPAQNANRHNSTGFRDGIPLITGSFGTQTVGSLAFIGTGAFGVTALTGGVDFTNTAWIQPELTTTSYSTTLQSGEFHTNGWTPPVSFDGYTPVAGDLIFQADANQSFAVDEPGALALVGASMIGLGLFGRRPRRRAQASASAR